VNFFTIDKLVSASRTSRAGGNVGVGCVETLALTRQTISGPWCVETQHVKPSGQRQIIQDRY